MNYNNNNTNSNSSHSYSHYNYQSDHLLNPNLFPDHHITSTNTTTSGHLQASAPPISSDYSSDFYFNPPFSQHPDHHFHPDSDLYRNRDTAFLDISVPNSNASLQSSAYYNDSLLSSYNHQVTNNYGGVVGDQFSGGVYRGNDGGGYGGGSGVVFDDYGRPINVPKGNQGNEVGSFSEILRDVPKVEDVEKDASGGVQKFRVKMLSEGGGQSDTDVLCQIGLDGIRILDPATNRILKIYQLETLTRWEVLDSYIFAFWVQSSMDNEPRRIRLKSNSYTTSNILDTVAAASIQLKEMAESNKPSTSDKESDSEKKKGFADWMNLVKPGYEEKDHWVPDEAVTKCTACRTDFGAFVRRHHCRNCGDIFCDKCTQGRIALTADEITQPVRVCDRCMAEVIQRLSNAKEVTASTGLQSHDELAKKLQEAMDKNRKTLTGVMPIGSDTRMRDVECPTCTVHLQVKVPASGSETIECYICRHPFLVGAH